MKIILFDIDGTLINAADADKRAFIRAFKDNFGLEPVVREVNKHGKTDTEITRIIALATFNRELKACELESLNNRYIEILQSEIENESRYRILPGVENLLKSLTKRKDVLVGLQTGNLRGAVEPKLSRGNLLRYFSFGGFGTDSDERSQIITTAIQRAESLLNDINVRPENVTVVGDAPQDVRAGKAIGAKTIAVTTGIYTRETLALECPSYIFPDLSDKYAFYTAVGLS